MSNDAGGLARKLKFVKLGMVAGPPASKLRLPGFSEAANNVAIGIENAQRGHTGCR